MSEYVDMCFRHKLLKMNFELNIDCWNSVNPDIKRIVSQEWQTIKYMNDDGTALNKEVDTVPNDVGGVYLFVLKPEIIPKYHVYIMYIGRARKKTSYSLRKRCKEYFTDTRPELLTMRKLWGAQLYFSYLPLQDDELIEAVERELIRVIIPPCNTQIPDYNVMPAKPAF